MKQNTLSSAGATLGSVKSETKAAAARENGKSGGRPRTNYFVSCIADDGQRKCGGWVKTTAKTDAGILAAAISQVWSTAPAASCGYRISAIVIDADTDRARQINA